MKIRLFGWTLELYRIPKIAFSCVVCGRIFACDQGEKKYCDGFDPCKDKCHKATRTTESICPACLRKGAKSEFPLGLA